MEEENTEYRKSRKETKKLTKRAKEYSWKDYGQHSTQFCPNNTSEFLSKV